MAEEAGSSKDTGASGATSNQGTGGNSAGLGSLKRQATNMFSTIKDGISNVVSKETKSSFVSLSNVKAKWLAEL